MAQSITPEVGHVLEQNRRIYDALLDNAMPAEFVENPDGEPLAVVSRNFMDPCRVLGSIGLKKSLEIADIVDKTTLGNTLPISGPNVYPSEFLSALDLVTRAAANRQNGLADHLLSPTGFDTDPAFSTKGRSFGLHADFIGSNRLVDEGLPVYGLNFHYTRWGSCIVRLGILRDSSYDEQLAGIVKQINKKMLPNSALRAAYEDLGAPYTEPITLNPGDLLIFQARQHQERGLVAVAHEFTTTSDSRRSDVFHPQLGDTKAVQIKREKFIRQHQLYDMGYAA